MDKTLMFVHITHNENFSIFDTKWLPQTAKFAAVGAKSNGSGFIKVYELDGEKLDVTREIARGNAFKCATFDVSQTNNYYLAVGGFGGSLQIIDLERFDVYNVDNAHKGVINAIDAAGSMANRGPTEIVTGGQDGLVKIWDPRSIRPVVQIESEGTKRDCWSVSFTNSYDRINRCVFAGYENGDIKLFDLRTLKVRWEINVPHGVCSLQADNKYERVRKLVAGTTFGGINAFYFDECDKWEPWFVFKKDTPSECDLGDPTIWCVRHLPQNRDIFATCGSNGMLKLWHSPDDCKEFYSNHLVSISELSIGEKLINCFDWSRDRAGLGVCCSMDKKLRVIATVELPLDQ